MRRLRLSARSKRYEHQCVPKTPGRPFRVRRATAAYKKLEKGRSGEGLPSRWRTGIIRASYLVSHGPLRLLVITARAAFRSRIRGTNTKPMKRSSNVARRRENL